MTVRLLLLILASVSLSALAQLALKIGTTAAAGGRVWFPRPEFCTDNGAMIALAGMLRLQAGERGDLDIRVRPRWPLTDLRPPAAMAATC